ncbi:hypothetical protein LR48_Vigan11g127300 [Vigna angularis]|uniref:Uncharacterized protein n=1 Tax=Phaseolus angularis TaxID=3914 RepID=A0A0L9VTZ5_PHAAN|nr:hypothetical protein LR48_Vigan11g127300 [Vigna angularis]
MALQENNSSEKTNSSGITKKFWDFTIASLHYLFDNLNTLPFISALVVTNKYVEIAVVPILMDYYNDSTEENQRISAIVRNLQDGLSSLFVVIVSLISEAYTGYYTMITFCTAASIEGLMLLWTSASATIPSSFSAVYGAIFFLALGTSGQKLLENFYEYQLEEKIKARHARSGSTENKKEQDFTDKVLIKSWLYAPFVVGYVITICFAFIRIDANYEHLFRLAALLMGGTYMLFLVGSVWYNREELPVESNLHKIYRIFKAALGKRHAKYPTSPSRYYWKDSKRDRSCEYREGVRLLPQVPRLFRWLDKAAILEAEDSTVSLELQEKNEKLCTVKEVRDVKSLIPMLYLCFAFFGYSLLLATQSTFFVSQASNMSSNITTNNNDISILVLIMEATSDVTRFICYLISRAFRHFKKFSCIDNVCNKKAAIARIGLGMVCAIICSLMAWQVEVGRLKVSTYEDRRNSTVALVPQFSALGITEGLIEGGIENLFHGHVAKSMWSFDDAYKEFVIGSGKLMIIPLVLSIPCWFGDTLDSSRLDKFYLTLGILNAACLLLFCYYSFRYAYKELLPQDDPAVEDENVDFVCQSSIEIESKNHSTDTD